MRNRNQRENLIEAAASGNLPELQTLLRHGVSVNAHFQDGYTALMAAAQSRQPEVLRALIAAGADLELAEEHGRTALMLAACASLPESVHLLLDAGADPNAQRFDGFAPFVGWTALMFAASCGQTHNMELLIAAGAKLDTQDVDGETALIKAVNACKSEAVEYLLHHGANAFAVTYEGRTARDYAAELGLTRLLALLELPKSARE